MLFMSIQCITSLFSRCIVGHPTLVSLTSLSIGNHFIALLKERTTVYIPAFALRCFHHGDYIFAQKKKKNVSLPFRLSLPSVGVLLFGYDLVLQ